MDAGFLRITPSSRSGFNFTYYIFLEGPACVTGGGLAGLATCFGLMSCVIGGGGWTGWTGCSLFWGFVTRVAPV